MKKEFEVLAEHKWVRNCVITESIAIDHSKNGFYYKQFMAVVDDSQNFKIFEGYYLPGDDHFIPFIIARVKDIQRKRTQAILRT